MRQARQIEFTIFDELLRIISNVIVDFFDSFQVISIDTFSYTQQNIGIIMSETSDLLVQTFHMFAVIFQRN